MPTPRLDKSEIDLLNLQGLSCLIANRKQARRLIRIAQAAAKAVEYERGLAYAQVNQFWLAYYAGDIEQAEPLCRPLRECFERSGDLEGGMAVDVALGALASRRGDFALAEQHFEQAREVAAHSPDTLHKFMLYSRIGIDALNRGDTRSGPRNFLLALDIAERFGTASHRVNSLSNLASSQHDLGNDEDAIPLLVEALDIIGNEKLAHQQALVSANLAMCLLASGKAGEALALVEPFYEEQQDDLAVRAFLFCIAAHASILIGRLDGAQALLGRAQLYARESEDFEEQMHAWLVLGVLESRRDRPEMALRALEQAHALLSWTRNPFYQQQIFELLADINARLGKWEAAYGLLRQYQAHFEAGSKSARDSRLLMRSL
ncbi:MAG TPA: GGDEF domain-containing protein, partial [Janthinobacterium sp.]|nr:GGDEF domain-containing protein [Janthinobacterium sp.]